MYIEFIADHSEDIARRAIEFQTHGKEKPSRQLMSRVTSMGELTHNAFLKAMDCVFSGDIQVANNVLEITKVIRSEHERLMKELPELPILRIVLLELARIADYVAGIAVMAINRALEKPSKISSVRISEI
jgi:phosphate uptake regulator